MNKKEAAAVAIIKDNLVLLGRRSDLCPLTNKKIPFGGYWSLFGGGKEESETLSECASRELKEETNLSLNHNDFIFLDIIENENCNLHIFLIDVKSMDDINSVLKLNYEHSTYGWFDLKTLDSIGGRIDPKVVKVLKKNRNFV